MANRTVFVNLGDSHAPLSGSDVATDNNNVPFVLQGDTTGVLSSYSTLAAAIADTANLVNGQFVIINTGDNAVTGFPDADKGIWHVDTNQGASAGDYTKVLNSVDHASELAIEDAGSYFTGTTGEAGLSELATAIGGATSATRDYSSNTYIADNDTITVALGKLDAAITGSSATDLLYNLAFTADGAIAATTDGPRMVGFGTSSNDVSLLDASQSTIKETVGFAVGSDYADNATIDQGRGTVLAGLVPGFTGLTPGAAYYADPANPGDITATVPTTVGYWIVPAGIAVTATELLVRIGESVQIVTPELTQQVGIHFRSTDNTSTGIGQTGYTITKGDLWVDKDATVQNPTHGTTGLYTVYVATADWTGAGSNLISSDVTSNFKVIGQQN